MHCQQPSSIREAGLRKAIHRFNRNRSMFSLSSHEASLQRLSRPVTLHGTAPCRDWVAFPFSTRAMQGARSMDFGRVATRGRVYPLPIKNIVVGLPHPAVPGDRRKPDANRSNARSLKPVGGHARPTRPHPLESRGAGTQEPAEPLEDHSRGWAQEAGRNPGRPFHRPGPFGRRDVTIGLIDPWRVLPITGDSRSVWSGQTRTTSDPCLERRSWCHKLFGKADD